VTGIPADVSIADNPAGGRLANEAMEPWGINQALTTTSLLLLSVQITLMFNVM